MVKILIIDDDSQITRVLCEFLRRQGFEASAVSDGEQGLRAAREIIPDLILCDLDMPALDGQAVVAALRQDPRLGETPVIFLSGCSERGRIRRTMNLGGDDFITKPAQLPEILEAINARLARRQKQLRQMDERLEQAAQIFAGIIDDLNKGASEVRWLADEASAEERQREILKKVRAGLDVPPPGPVAAKPPPPAALLVKKDNRQQFLKLSEVKALTADGEYSVVHWGRDQHLLFRKPLKQWERELPNQFVRAHRQAIVNLAFLDFVQKTAAGHLQVHLREFKEIIPVSQRETGEFNRRLKAFQAA